MSAYIAGRLAGRARDIGMQYKQTFSIFFIIFLSINFMRVRVWATCAQNLGAKVQKKSDICKFIFHFYVFCKKNQKNRPIKSDFY